MIWQILKKILNRFSTDNIHKGLAVLLLILLTGTLGYSFFESTSLENGLWWSIVTMTTVGYGDLFPTTLGGRVLAVLIMTTGIGILGAITGSFANALMEKKLKEIKGMKAFKLKNHFLICGWNSRGKDIIQEMRADKKSRGSDIVIITDLPESPCETTKGVHFVRGDINGETLDRANIHKAKAAIILCDETQDIYSRDAKSILAALTIKKKKASIYISVEISDSANYEQCRITGADEIIVSGELTTNLLVQSVLDHGIPKCINELVSNRAGQVFFKTEPEKSLIGKSFSEVLLHYKNTHDILVIGIEKNKGEIITNPPATLVLQNNHKLIVIAKERPA